MNNIEELKKAALGANLHGWTGFEDALNDDGYSEAVSKFIGHCSPSTILALIAQLEAAQKERDALKMNLSDAGCWLVEWKQRVEQSERRANALEAELSEAQKERDEEKRKAKQFIESFDNAMHECSRRSDQIRELKAELSAANEKLSKPVVLPRMHVGFDGVSTNAGDSVRNKAISDCAETIRVAGFTVDEGQDLWLT